MTDVVLNFVGDDQRIALDAAARATAVLADAGFVAVSNDLLGSDTIGAVAADLALGGASLIAAAPDAAADAALSAIAADQAAQISARFNTKALADAGIAGVAANAYIEVAVDESQNSQRVLYQKVSGAYVMIRVLGDLSTDALIQRYGFGAHMRFALSAMSKVNRDEVGSNGAGNPNDLPKAITASQSGFTVTASTAVFNKLHVGCVIRWASGEEARIVSATTASATTCTVDRSQTVSSSAATIDAKSVCFVFQGDSLGHRIAGFMTRWGYRALGFGGAVFMANNTDSNDFQFQEVNLAGGAAVTSSTTEASTFPYSMYWNVPAGGTVTFNFLSGFSNGAAQPLRLGIAPELQVTDTAYVVWRRGAGSITIQRKRFSDATWVDVTTIADCSTGTRAFNFYKATHTLGAEWQYRVLGVSGTVKVLCTALLNLTTPGFVPWRISRGSYATNSRDLEDFNTLATGDLAELCQLFMPDARFTLTADGSSAQTSPSDHITYIENSTTQWNTAWPYLDHVWLELWKDQSQPLVGAAYDTALRRHALANDHSYVPLRDLFGDWTTQGSALGWVDDNVHPGKTGSLVMMHQVLRVTGLDQVPQTAEARDVSGWNLRGRKIFLRGQDLEPDLIALRNRLSTQRRGAKWNSGSMTLLGASALGAALGTTDFTLSFDFDSLATVPSQYIASIGADGTSLGQNGGLIIVQINQLLSLYLRDASGNSIEYRYTFFGNVYGGQRGTLTIRSDVANTRFDLFWNGEPMRALVGTVTGTTTSPLGTWAGTGTQFGIPQGNAADRSSNFYSAAAWRSRLSDAEIRANVIAGAPTTTAPDFFWDFSDNGGRVVSDRTANARHGFFIRSNPNQYAIGDGSHWLYPERHLLKRGWLQAVGGAATNLFGGDDMVVNHTSRQTCTLPSAPSVGDRIALRGRGSGGWQLAQPALTQILTGAGGTVGTNATTIGTSGRINSGARYDSIEVECIRSEAGVAFEWVVTASTGSLSWA